MEKLKEKLKNFWEKTKSVAKKVWAYLLDAKMEYLMMIGFFALDLITKAIVDATIPENGAVTVIPHFLSFAYIRNYNAIFGSDAVTKFMGAVGSRILFCVFSIVVAVVCVLILIRQRGKSKLFRASLALLAAGALGNCMDRWALGYVRDFISFSFFPYVFNIADTVLVTGVCMMLLYFIAFYERDKKKQVLLNGDEVSESDKENSGDGANKDEAQNNADKANSIGDEVEGGGDNASNSDGGEKKADDILNVENTEDITSEKECDGVNSSDETKSEGRL